ncbi:MAG: Hsp20/alpha crystallin family protein [Planctomycetota bacterium]|jgi:HSP20 family protein
MNSEKGGKFVYVFSSDRGGGSPRYHWRPNTDIYETESAVVVELEIPGVRTEDLEVTQYENRIVVRGLRRVDPDVRVQRFHQMEIVCGSFEKELALPRALAGAPVEATLVRGILSLKIHKTKPAAGGVERKITIEAE